MPKSKRNMRILYAMALLQGMVFYGPISSLYRQAAGLNLAQIALIEGASYIFCILMEIPWGMLADRVGYRKSMIACSGFYFLSKLIFWRAEGFGGFLLERFVMSAAIAGLTGVDQSLLVLSCGDGDSHRSFGVRDACSTAGMLLAAVVYAAFIGESYRLSALLTAAAYGFALLLSFGIEDVRPKEPLPPFSLRSFQQLLGKTLQNKRFLIFLLGYALYTEGVQTATVWLNQNQYLRSGMGEVGIGLAFILATLLGLSSAFSKRLTDALGERRFAALSFAVAAICCALLCVVRTPWLSIACICLISTSRALLNPLTATLCNEQIRGADRASQLSAFALLQDCVSSASSAAYGAAAEWKLNAGFMLCAAACVVGWACYRRNAYKGK